MSSARVCAGNTLHVWRRAWAIIHYSIVAFALVYELWAKRIWTTGRRPLSRLVSSLHYSRTVKCPLTGLHRPSWRSLFNTLSIFICTTNIKLLLRWRSWGLISDFFFCSSPQTAINRHYAMKLNKIYRDKRRLLNLVVVRLFMRLKGSGEKHSL